ncbi:5-hydroxytryptamine receptor 7 [Eumeta japonica]|uniref:5-hydroxytryptamine receptor 7 n=1 Tax=Eumeta variegata TaxID=151549 RepID=A0A4C1YFX1_EUMVA|nr:5-hydroxytryptamine receptor 7 [Eumeta japonica]
MSQGESIYENPLFLTVILSYVPVRSAQASAGGAGWGEFAAMCVLALATVFGNAAVLVALRRAPTAPAHAPLTSLAAADLLLGLTVLPLAAARECFSFCIGHTLAGGGGLVPPLGTPGTWVRIAVSSTLYPTCNECLLVEWYVERNKRGEPDVLCCTASILSLCALGWERWSGVTEPLKKAKRARLAKLHSWLLWPVAAMVAVPTALVPTRASDKPCVVNTNIGYVFYSITISFYVPASVMVILYVRVLTSLASPLIVRAHRGSRSPATPRAASTTTVRITTAESTTTPIKSRTTASTAGVFTVTTNRSPTRILITMSESESKAFPKDPPGTESSSKSVRSFKISGDIRDGARVEQRKALLILQLKQNPMIGDLTPSPRDDKTILKKLKLDLCLSLSSDHPPTRAFDFGIESANESGRFQNSVPKRGSRMRGPSDLSSAPRHPHHNSADVVVFDLLDAFFRHATHCGTDPFMCESDLLLAFFLTDAFCDCVSDAAWRWCTWLGYANSALDPLVYATASPSMRRALQSTISLSRSDPTTSGSSPVRTPRDRHSKIPKNISDSPNKSLSLIEIVEASNVKIIKITQNEI